MRVFVGCLAEDFSIQVGQGSKQGNRSMTFVIVGLRTAVAARDGQAGLGPFQGLTLALLIATQHQGAVRGIQIETNDIPEFLFEVFVVGKLEGTQDVRFDGIGTPEPLHGGLRHAHRAGHGPYRPAGAMGWRLGRTDDDLLPDLGMDLLFPSSALGLAQARHTRLAELLFPMNHHPSAHPDFPGGLHLAQTIGTVENDPGSAVISLSHGRTVDDDAQCAPLFRTNIECTYRSRHGQHTTAKMLVMYTEL